MSERPFAFDPHPPPYVTPLPASATAANDETHIPGPPLLPTGMGSDTERSTLPPLAPLEEIRARLASIEDAIVDPRGLLHSLLAELDRKATARHEETMRTLTTIANGVAELSDRVAQLEPAVEIHEAKLRLVDLEAHAANGSAE